MLFHLSFLLRLNGRFLSPRIRFRVLLLNNTCSTEFSIVSKLLSVLLNVIPEENPNHRAPKAQGQTSSSTGDAVLSAPFLIFSVFTHVRKSWQQLRWRWDVWRWADPFEPISSYGLQRGAYTGRRVMYYLGWVLPRRLIRAWLREAVTGCFSPSAQEWRRTRGCHTGPDQYLHTLNVKRWKAISLGLSRALVAPLGCLGDISLMRYMMGHAMVQIPCWLKPMSVRGVYPRP